MKDYNYTYYLSEQLDPFLTEEEKKILAKSSLILDGIQSILDMLDREERKQREILRVEENKIKDIKSRAQLLMHANCNHKWIIIDQNNDFDHHYGFSRRNPCDIFDWCQNISIHSHEKCRICGLVKGGPCYAY